MKNLFAFFILPGLVLCNGVIWDKTIEIHGARYGKTQFLSFPFVSSGLTHIFWMNYEGSNLAIHFQTRLADGSLTADKILNPEHVSDPTRLAGMSVQTSDEGNHLMVAYHGYRFSPNGHCSGSMNDGCSEIFFIESLNGGKDWSSPVRMPRNEMTDIKHRQYPSLLYQKDTKQIYIAYVCNGELAIAMKKPGSSSFEKEMIILGKDYIFTMTLAYTVDRASSKRYLHLFWKKDHGNSLFYIYSTDEGRTWSKNTEIINDVILKNPPVLANDPETSAGGIFIEYFFKKSIQILYTENHGNNWKTIKSGSDFHGSHAVALCGKLFSMNARIRLGTGFIRFKELNSEKFTSLSYPFSTPQSIDETDLHCEYKNKKLAISALIHDDHRKVILLAHGLMDETAIMQ